MHIKMVRSFSQTRLYQLCNIVTLRNEKIAVLFSCSIYFNVKIHMVFKPPEIKEFCLNGKAEI